MRTIATLLALAVLVIGTAARAAEPELKTDEDKAFYSFGLNLSQQLGGLHAKCQRHRKGPVPTTRRDRLHKSGDTNVSQRATAVNVGIIAGNDVRSF